MKLYNLLRSEECHKNGYYKQSRQENGQYPVLFKPSLGRTLVCRDDRSVDVVLSYHSLAYWGRSRNKCGIFTHWADLMPAGTAPD